MFEYLLKQRLQSLGELGESVIESKLFIGSLIPMMTKALPLSTMSFHVTNGTSNANVLVQ